MWQIFRWLFRHSVLTAHEIFRHALSIAHDQTIKSPAVARRDKWIETICKRLEVLEERLKPIIENKILEDEEFVSLFLQATKFAIETHDNEKIEILANSVLNLRIEECLFDFKIIVLNKIGTLTAVEVSVLMFVYKNSKVFIDSYNYQNYLNSYNDYTQKTNVNINQFISIIEGLADNNLIRIGNITNPVLKRVRSSSVLGGAIEKDILPGIVVKDLGEDVLRYVIESQI